MDKPTQIGTPRNNKTVFYNMYLVVSRRTLMSNNTSSFQNTFLPTMPQDNVEEVREALLAARAQSGENPVFYRKI